MKRKYFVGVRETNIRYFSVDANTPEEARALVVKRGPEVTDLETIEYSHELEPDTWSVEEHHDE